MCDKEGIGKGKIDTYPLHPYLLNGERKDTIMSLTKAAIAESVRDQCGFPSDRSSQLVSATLELITKRLESGEDVLISGFGKFCVMERNGHMGRSGASRAEISLGSRRVVTFRCSPLLREKLNEKDQSGGFGT